jgi:hypothetical protein
MGGRLKTAVPPEMYLALASTFRPALFKGVIMVFPQLAEPWFLTATAESAELRPRPTASI